MANLEIRAGIDMETGVNRPVSQYNNSREAVPEGGVYLTWEDLWVRVPKGRNYGSSKPILQGLTGYARPGELMAIMGPSGCGKSTLLDALAGKVFKNSRITNFYESPSVHNVESGVINVNVEF